MIRDVLSEASLSRLRGGEQTIGVLVQKPDSLSRLRGGERITASSPIAIDSLSRLRGGELYSVVLNVF